MCGNFEIFYKIAQYHIWYSAHKDILFFDYIMIFSFSVRYFVIIFSTPLEYKWICILFRFML